MFSVFEIILRVAEGVVAAEIGELKETNKWLRGTEECDEAIDGDGNESVHAQDGSVRRIPLPPFDEFTIYGGTNKIQCFWPNCKQQWCTYLQLMNHMKRNHAVKQTAFKNTYFGEQVCKEYQVNRGKRNACTSGMCDNEQSIQTHKGTALEACEERRDSPSDKTAAEDKTAPHNNCVFASTRVADEHKKSMVEIQSIVDQPIGNQGCGTGCLHTNDDHIAQQNALNEPMILEEIQSTAISAQCDRETTADQIQHRWAVRQCYIKVDMAGNAVLPIEVHGLYVAGDEICNDVAAIIAQSNNNVISPPWCEENASVEKGRGVGKVETELVRDEKRKARIDENACNCGGENYMHAITSRKLQGGNCDLGAEADISNKNTGAIEIYTPPPTTRKPTSTSSDGTVGDPLMHIEILSCINENSSALVPPSATCNTQPSPIAMVSEMYYGYKEKQHTEMKAMNWKLDVPKVTIKRTYLESEAPLAKREGVNRATFPSELKGDFVDMPAFKAYLADEATGEENARKIALGAGRGLGCLEVSDVCGEMIEVTDVRALVGMYLCNQHELLIGCGVFQPKFQWSEYVMVGLRSYIAFQKRKLQDMIIKGDSGPLKDYMNVLDCIYVALKGGHAKKCREHKELGYVAKGEEDLIAIKGMAPWSRLQEGVRNAYCMMQKIVHDYENADALPPKIRGLANSIVAGAFHYDTFCGRKWEIEHALYDVIMDALTSAREYFKCRKHKTFKIYGDIIKLLTPGLFQCLFAYSKLPRPTACKYFIVPVSLGAETISMHTSLKTFSNTFLKECKVKLTTNQVRKLFHKKLMSLTKNENRLKDFMSILDAHGRKVIDKHYLLKDPEDDVVMAKALVSQVIGKTVAWPTQESVDEFSVTNDFDKIVEGVIMEAELQNEDEDCDDGDGDDDCLEWWKFGELFGMKRRDHDCLLPLMDTPTMRKCSGKLLALADGSVAPQEITIAKAQMKAPLPEDRKRNKIEITKQQQAVYDKYTHQKSLTGRKSKVDPDAHKKIHEALMDWQAEHGKQIVDKPLHIDWFWDLRIKLIQENVLSMHHCWDVCRNSVKVFCKKKQDEGHSLENIGGVHKKRRVE